MPDVSFLDLAIVAGIAFGIPLPLGLVPRLRLPSSVLEIVAGILVGPAVLGWVKLELTQDVSGDRFSERNAAGGWSSATRYLGPARRD
jgi:Kef-type K+ transport system membrane component KefB